MDLLTLKQKMDEARYIYDDTLATVLAVALQLGRPLLIEGAAGVGKTEIAKVMASALDRDLVRLQCYEGLDESKALYEWNYQKQLLSIQVNMGSKDSDELTKSLFSDEYLLERPLLKSIRSEKPVVLLIDEIDKADEEFEAFLLELLSEMQVTIPEVGTIKAKSVPFVVLTSNRARTCISSIRIWRRNWPSCGPSCPMWTTASMPRWPWLCRSSAPANPFSRNPPLPKPWIGQRRWMPLASGN